MLHLMQRLTQLKSHAHAGKILKRISAVALMRINDRVSRRQNIRRRVMISNDDLQPCRGSSHLVYAADTAVTVTKSVVPASAKAASASLFSP